MTSRVMSPFGSISDSPSGRRGLRLLNPQRWNYPSPIRSWTSAHASTGSPSRSPEEASEGGWSPADGIEIAWLRHQRQLGLPQAVHAAIERSRTIAELHDDWDGEGSRGYSIETLGRAAELLQSIASGLPLSSQGSLSVADITPGPDGSVDIEVVVGEKRLLLNASYEPESPVLFYGYSTNRSFPIEGELGPQNSTRFLAEWLIA